MTFRFENREKRGKLERQRGDIGGHRPKFTPVLGPECLSFIIPGRVQRKKHFSLAFGKQGQKLKDRLICVRLKKLLDGNLADFGFNILTEKPRGFKMSSERRYILRTPVSER